MSRILRTAVFALNETILETNNVCVDDQMSHLKQTRTKARADLLQVRCLLVEVIEQQSQLATRCPRVEIMTEVDALTPDRCLRSEARAQLTG